MNRVREYSLVLMCAVLWITPGYSLALAPSSAPDSLTSVGDKLYFSADDGIHGRELWVYDEQAKEPMLVADIWPGERGSNPSNFISLGDNLLFAAETQDLSRRGYTLGVELWVSDGTAKGTQLIQNIGPGEESGFRKWITSRDGVAYFEAVTPEMGEELWRTDGTVDGTRLLADIWAGADGSQPASRDHGWLPDGRLILIVFRDAENVLLVINPNDGTYEILKVVDLEAHVLREAVSVVFFTTKDPEHGWELWKTDGTQAGTVFVKDINPGKPDASPGSMLAHGGKAYFPAADAVHGRELWVTDGTESGTHLVKDVYPGAADSSPYQLTSSGPYVYFAASGENVGVEIWRTDGSEEETILLRNINLGQANSNPYSLIDLVGRLVFGATSSEYGVELWESNGTPAGTRLLKDILRGPSLEPSGNPYRLTNHGANIYFHATTLENGVELWRTDGTSEGTTLVADIFTETRPNPSSSPHNLTAMNDTLFFVARDSDHGNELWRTTDAPDRVRMVKDIFPGSAGSDPHHITAVGSILFFGADDGTNGNELWCSDGTEAGTRLVQDYAPTQANSSPKELTMYKNTLYFVAWNERDGEELLKVEDMRIHRVMDIYPGPASSSPRELVVVGNVLYFRANDGTSGDELWECSGAEYNTRMVRDLLPRTTTSTLPTWLTPLEQKLYFVASDGSRGLELWSIETSGAGPAMVADIARGPGAESLIADVHDSSRSNTR